MDLSFEVGIILRDHPIPLTSQEVAKLLKEKRVASEKRFFPKMKLYLSPPPRLTDVRAALKKLSAGNVIHERVRPGGPTRWVKRNKR